jgi:large subunit ribosomal protein L4
MPEAPRIGTDGDPVPLDDAAFGVRFNESLVHETVRAELNARRQGTASTRTRGMVRGGGAKPWRQKGTGRARAGSIRSPLWAGGGTVFGPSPRRYTVKVNRKARRAALRSALSAHAQRGSIAVLDVTMFDAPATKRAAELLAGWGEPQPALVVLAEDEVHAAKSFRNLPRVAVSTAAGTGVADLVLAASLVVSDAALEELTARARGDRREPAAAGSEPEPATEGAA